MAHADQSCVHNVPRAKDLKAGQAVLNRLTGISATENLCMVVAEHHRSIVYTINGENFRASQLPLADIFAKHTRSIDYNSSELKASRIYTIAFHEGCKWDKFKKADNGITRISRSLFNAVNFIAQSSILVD